MDEFLICNHRLLADNWDDWKVIPSVAGSVANGRYWLPHYEAVQRGWTGDHKIIDAIKADPLLSRLLKAKITFLDDSDFLKGAQPPRVRSLRKMPRIAVRMQAKSARAMSIESYD